MKKILLMLPLLAMVAGCDQFSQGQQLSTAGGAVVGALVSPNNPVAGAAVGGAVGLAASTLIEHNSSGQCVYQRPNGSRYTAHC